MGTKQQATREPSGRPRGRLLALSAAGLAVAMGIVAGVAMAVGGEPPGSRGEELKNAGGAAAAAAAPTAPPEHNPLVVDRSTAGGLRMGLEQLLGYDTVVTARLVEARVRGDDAVAQVTETVLQHNTSDLAGLVAELYGADAGSTVQRLWESRTAAAGEYATAVAGGDAAKARSARERLRESSQEIAEFFAARTGGAVPADELSAGRWADHLTGVADAYADGRYADALALVHDAHELAFSVSRSLAAGIWSHQAPLPSDFDAPAQQLSSGLGLLLGEHTQLAVDVTRSGLAGLDDFDAVTVALDDNTERLRSALEAVGGPGAGATFSTLWAHHVDALVAFTRAVAEEDETAKQAALDHMQAFSGDMAAFLESATEGRLTRADLAVAVGQHDRLLLAQVEAYHAQDYASAFTLSTEAYRHAVALAAQTGDALAATVAARTPQGAPQTGLGGMATSGVRP